MCIYTHTHTHRSLEVASPRRRRPPRRRRTRTWPGSRRSWWRGRRRSSPRRRGPRPQRRRPRRRGAHLATEIQTLLYVLFKLFIHVIVHYSISYGICCIMSCHAILQSTGLVEAAGSGPGRDDGLPQRAGGRAGRGANSHCPSRGDPSNIVSILCYNSLHSTITLYDIYYEWLHGRGAEGLLRGGGAPPAARDGAPPALPG